MFGAKYGEFHKNGALGTISSNLEPRVKETVAWLSGISCVVIASVVARINSKLKSFEHFQMILAKQNYVVLAWKICPSPR